MLQKLEEEAIQVHRVYSGKIINLRRDAVRLPNGREATREVVEHPGAVAIVPVTNNGEIILVRQFRYPVGQVLLEIPAGKLDPGETPEDCAARELIEETGFRAGRLQKMVSVFTGPGFTNEVIHIFLAQDLKEVGQALDSDEMLDVEFYSPPEISRLISANVIKDAKTIVGLSLSGLLPINK